MSVPNVVHCYHVNINTGDGQIVLLVDNKSPATGKRGKVHSAVLMDGGKGHGTNMLNTMKYICNNYEFQVGKFFDDTPAPNTVLKFDSVIITHWDLDHYAGAFGVLRDGYLKSVNAWNTAHPQSPALAEDIIPFANTALVNDGTVKEPRKRKNAKAKKDVGLPSSSVPTSAATAASPPPSSYTTTSYKCAYLKYQNISGSTDWTCKSTIYTPYWNGHFAEKKPGTETKRRRKNDPSTSAHGAAWSQLTKITKKYSGAAGDLKITGSLDYTILALDTATPTVSTRTVDLVVKSLHVQNAAGSKDVRFIKTANFVSDRRELIGVDFFTHKIPTTGTPQSWRLFTSTTALVGSHGSPPVGLYCIGADGEVIGTPLVKLDNKAKSAFKAKGDVLGERASTVPIGPSVPTVPIVPTPPLTNPTVPSVPIVPPNPGTPTAPIVPAADPIVLVPGGRSKLSALVASGHPSSLPSATLKEQNLTQPVGAESTSDRVILAKTKSEPSHGVVRVIDSDDSTGTNRSSIIALIIFNDGRTQHYLGGDADYPVEIAAATWINQRVPLMKLSHHGADHSTPLPLINILNPDRIVCSAGDFAKYAHPRWETVLFFDLRERVRKKKWTPTPAVPLAGGAPILTPTLADYHSPFYNTMYPIWLSTNVDYSVDTLEVIAGLPTSVSAPAIFCKWLLKMWNYIGVTPENTPYWEINKAKPTKEAEYQSKTPTPRGQTVASMKWHPGKEETLNADQKADNAWITGRKKHKNDEVRRQLAPVLLEAWGNISYIGRSRGRPGSVATTSASSAVGTTTISTNEQILFILAEVSQPGPDFDGAAGPQLNIVLNNFSRPGEDVGIEISVWNTNLEKIDYPAPVRTPSVATNPEIILPIGSENHPMDPGPIPDSSELFALSVFDDSYWPAPSVASNPPVNDGFPSLPIVEPAVVYASSGESISLLTTDQMSTEDPPPSLDMLSAVYQSTERNDSSVLDALKPALGLFPQDNLIHFNDYSTFSTSMSIEPGEDTMDHMDTNGLLHGVTVPMYQSFFDQTVALTSDFFPKEDMDRTESMNTSSKMVLNRGASRVVLNSEPSGSGSSITPGKRLLTEASAPTPKPTTRAATSSTVHFYLSSFRFPASAERETQVRLDSNTMPNTFVTRLERGAIATNDKLIATGVDLVDNDTLALRLGYNGVGGILTVYGTGNKITAFSLKTRMTLNGQLPTPLWDLVFDSRSTNSAFRRPPAVPSTTIASLDDHGILPPASTLVMGLKTTGFTTTMTQVLKVFHFPYSNLLGIASGVDLTLNVDDNPGSRNAVWIYSNPRYTTVTRLKMHITPAEKHHIEDLLKNISTSITLDDLVVIVTRQSDCQTMGERTEISMVSSISIAATVTFSEGFQFTGTIAFSPGSLRLILSNDKSFTIEQMADWLSKLLGVPDKFWNWIPGLDKIVVKQIIVGLEGDHLSKGNFKIDLEIALNFGSKGKKVVFLLSFSGPPFRFSGQMWTKAGLTALHPEQRALNPFWEPYKTLLPTSGGLAPPYTDLADSVSLLEMIPGASVATQPKWVPLNVSAVSLQVDQLALQFSGTLICAPPDEGDIPPIKLGQLSLSAWYDRTTPKDQPSNFWFELTGVVVITPKDDPISNAEVDVSVQYKSNTSSWTIEGTARDINLGMLYSFFDSNDRDLMADILGAITVQYFDVLYQFQTGANAANPSSLAIDGILTIGGIELVLQYQHLGKSATTGKAAWSLHAFLSAAVQTPETIGSIADSILGGSISNLIPDFITNVAINLGDGGDPTDAPFQLDVERVGDIMVLAAKIQLTDHVSVTFVQCSKEAPAGSTTKTLPKRVIRFTLDGFPTVSGIPLIRSLPQPFDEMHYVWVQDNNVDPAHPDAVPGFSQVEIDSINWVLPDADQIPYKATVKPKTAGRSATATAAPTVLASGHHFMIVSSGVVALDYRFEANQKAAANTSGGGGGGSLKVVAPPRHLAVSRLSTTTPEPAKNDVAMGTMQKTIGPLSVANVGLQYKNNILWLFLDATVHLGPIEFALLGFGIGLDLTNLTLDNIASFFEKLPGSIHLQLNGIALGFDQPPIVAMGVFMKAVDRNAYFGGVALSFVPYTFLAVGAYEEKDKPGGGSYKSVFVFAKLDGPLITLEFAEIRGVKIGFGYNSKVRFPTISEVTTFPFIQDADIDAKPDPLAVLQSITSKNWVTPEENQLWMAAGLKVLAFEAVSVSAVACFTFGASSLALGIFAEAVARMPTGAPIKTCFINVELGIVVYVDFLGGIFRAEAQLSPNSFVICPECHLTGGFALCYWFPGSDHVGDWVFTIGGYHRAFDVPSHYPTPPRLGISWNLDDCLSITGEAYFAITPKCAMGGGRLEIVFSCGPIYAYVDAHADFLINFKPFHFMGEVGVTIGVQFRLDIGLIHIRIGADIGADLQLQGPPFGGIAHVDFYICGFDIRFGPQPGPAPVLSLDDFYTFVKETGPTSKVPPTDTADPAQSFLLHNLEDGAVADSGTSKSVPGTPWVVRAGSFLFRISTAFALSKAHCNTAPAQENMVPFYSKPMHVTKAIDSQLFVTITLDTDKNKDVKFRPFALMKDVPAAAWALYDPNQDPSSSSADTLLSPSGGTSSEMMGLIIAHPYPILSEDKIVAFNAHDAMNEDIFPGVDNPLLPSRPSTQSSWIPAISAKADLPAYQAVANAWSNAPQKNLVSDLLATWTDVLDWDLSAPEDKVTKDKSTIAPDVPRTSLVGAPPRELMLKDFETYFVGLPTMASAA